MKLSVVKSFVKLHLLTPRGLFRLVRCFMSEGITLMALLRFASIYYSDDCALVCDGRRLKYKEMYRQAQSLSSVLHADYGVNPHQNIAFICRNSIISSLAIIALSRLRANIKLLNTDMPATTVQTRLSKGNIDLLIYDDDIAERCLPKSLDCKSVSTNKLLNLSPTIPQGEGEQPSRYRPSPFGSASISVLTGGSSGNYTEAGRRSNVTQFLPPLFALIQDIHIQDYDSVLIALPFYHGFGLATFIVSLIMGKKMCMMKHFDTAQSLALIKEEAIEVLTLVPALITRLMQTDNARESLQAVKCIISGGDRLERAQIDKTVQNVGTVLFNLYGTSEAGFFMLATPSDLSRHDEVTIGRPIPCAKCDVRNVDAKGHGELWVKSGWAMLTAENRWQNTGDIVFRNSDGYYFYKGRKDNMTVCAGENVYPENVERILNTHPLVLNSHVFPASAPHFGTVLHAKVELTPSASLSIEELKAYLRPRLSRAEMPHHIIFTNIELLSSGKKKKG